MVYIISDKVIQKREGKAAQDTDRKPEPELLPPFDGRHQKDQFQKNSGKNIPEFINKKI